MTDVLSPVDGMVTTEVADGRELGPEVMDSYTDVKSVWVDLVPPA